MIGLVKHPPKFCFAKLRQARACKAHRASKMPSSLTISKMHCYFCQKNLKEVNFKDAKVLENFISAAGKIKRRKKTRLCQRHQKKVAQAIKRARFLALLPYVRE